MKFEDYNRDDLHLFEKRKRPHKKFARYGKYNTLGERLIALSRGLTKYQERVGQSPMFQY